MHCWSPTATRCIAAALWCALAAAPLAAARGGELTLHLSGGEDVELVAALRRSDGDGNPLRQVDPKARIERPQVDHLARSLGDGTWQLQLPPGRYDLVLVAANRRLRIEGFHFPPVLEFDPALTPADAADEAARRWIAGDIAKARRYENKVIPLHFAAKDPQVRVLVQLLRDKPTSFDAQLGEQAATLRHEVWQYTKRYGAWSKEKRTRVLDRVLMAKRELRRWTWIWEPKLGAIEVGDSPVVVKYAVPPKFTAELHRGLLPY